TVNDSVYTATGVYTQMLKNAAGCDSTLTVDVTILEPTTETIYVDGCETVTVNDSVYTATGVYTQMLKNAAGCDSTLTVDVTILEPTEETIERIVCDQLTLNGITYTESGVYTQTLTNSEGCDSILTINLTVNESAEQTLTRTACGSYELNGRVYRQSGRYVQGLTTSNGCGLTITLNLTILESTEENIDVSDCNSVTVNNEVYTESGTYTQNLENAAGCDSTLTINVTILEPTAETIEVEGCGSVTVNDSVYTISGTYTQNLTNAAGCDSTLTIIATVLESSEETIEISDCDVVTVNDVEYTTSGTYTQTLTNAAGCDSTLTIIATVLESSQETIIASTCSAFTINDETYTETGIYRQTLTNSVGCDSILTINLTVGDDSAPIAVSKDTIIALDANGTATITVEDINNGSTDNCSIDTMFIDKTDFTCANVGTNEVILTVIDANGNVATDTAIVTVEAGDADCGQVRVLAEPDVLTLVVCPGGIVNGEFNLLANDEGIGASGVTLTADNLPENVQVSLTDGQVLYANEELSEAVIQFTYTICSNTDGENCSSAEATIYVQLDSDCDGVPDVTDIDDDDDGILDVIEEENALNQSTLDSDGDGIVDRLDIDSDNDGIVDNIEWQSTIAEGGTEDYVQPTGNDTNGDGWDDAYDSENGGYSYSPWDTDLDGTPDYLDTDTDGDGIEDAVEGWDAMPHDTIADVQPTGNDTDKDGLDDAYDTYNTTTQWLTGLNAIGSNAPLQDMAGDTINGVRDWRDDYVKPEDPDTTRPVRPIGLVIPEGFSPNTDNKNDYFEIQLNPDDTNNTLFGEEYPDAHLYIYNRWGNLIFEKEHYGNYAIWGSNKADAWWDGRSDNSLTVGSGKVPPATYIYILILDGNTVEKGTLFINY
ncbi:gliding motility-associated C-terminal domain-containing protein, partial [Maribellus sediminis]|uniref:gliding motility-associated C-terminal domain-containing protein n=1 Tax=Maribellus sediminis TaxID=2696285 RepID=UPI00142F4601